MNQSVNEVNDINLIEMDPDLNVRHPNSNNYNKTIEN